jgi:hypothetical protein
MASAKMAKISSKIMKSRKAKIMASAIVKWRNSVMEVKIMAYQRENNRNMK